MKLPGQQHDGAKRQQRHGQKCAGRRRIVDHSNCLRRFHRALEQFDGAEHPEGDECAGGEKRHQLDDGFGGDRQHQTMLVFGGVALPRSEQNGKYCHREGHDQRDVADHRNSGKRLVFAQDGFQ